VSLEGLEDHVVLVNFWATWCHECRAELPVLDRLHREYATRRLTVLSAKFREEP
jgi:thiol-disulfide isomerase/thioredoxin